jgi:hypothetical protein
VVNPQEIDDILNNACGSSEELEDKNEELEDEV